MTVSQAIVKWLKKNTSVEIIRVDTDYLQAKEGSYGIYSAPNRNVNEYIDGSYEVTEYYNILIKQSNKTNNERLETSEWLENLAYWIDDCDYNRIYPELSDNKECLGISLANRPYPFETDGDTTIYQLGIEIAYSRNHKEMEE